MPDTTAFTGNKSPTDVFSQESRSEYFKLTPDKKYFWGKNLITIRIDEFKISKC